MTKYRLKLVYILLTLMLITCRSGKDTPTPKFVQPEPIKTSTTIPPTLTLEQKIKTPTDSPTDTLEPTDTNTPPTLTLVPFLPAGLAQIGKDNIADLKIVAELSASEIYALAFSQSGKKLVTLSEHWEDRSNYLQIWDLTSGELLLNLDDLESPWNPSFSTDENFLYILYPSEGIAIYDLNQKKLTRIMDVKADWSAFSPDGNILMVGNYLGTPDESTIRLLDMDTDEVRMTLTHPGMVMYLEFSPDGDYLIAGFQGQKHFRDLVWEESTLELVADFIDYNHNLTFTPKGDMIATVKDRKVYIFSTDQWVLNHYYGFDDPYSNVKPKDFSESGDLLAVEDRYDILFLDAMTGETLFDLPGECDVRFSPDGTTLFTWCYQGEMKIWGAMP